MVEKTKPLRVAIVGGGPGCKAIMDMIFAEKLGQLRMNLIGVACTNPRAVGYRYAQQKGIYTTEDYRVMYELEGLDMIIELTGRDEVAKDISLTKPDSVRLIDHVAARLFWDIFQIEEESISACKRVEEELREARDDLERRVEERTSELSRSNALLKRELNERKRIEEELQKKNEELENFVNFVSHDLKTPIIGVQGLSYRLLKNYQDKLDERGRMYLEQIKANVRRMEIFVSDLLSLAKTGHIAPTFRYVPTCEILEDLTLRLQPRLKVKGIKLAVADNLPTIYCDREKISQVFENLLVNAIKFIGDTKNPTTEIGYEDKGDFIQFFVRDNGIGIDAKYHKQIFEMFQRLKETKDDEGTGIGLAIVGGIVKSHGGSIWVDSEPGKGSTFYFTIPSAG